MIVFHDKEEKGTFLSLISLTYGIRAPKIRQLLQPFLIRENFVDIQDFKGVITNPNMSRKEDVRVIIDHIPNMVDEER